MTVEELKQMKISLGLTNREIADRSGVPLGTVQKIFANVTAAPRRKTLLAIEKALRSSYSNVSAESSGMVSDTEVAYYSAPGAKHTFARQGHYTVDDYHALPDDMKVELIDGVFYELNAPTVDHQTIILEIAYQLRSCEDAKSDCQIILSPVDIQLDCDNRTILEPDLSVLCDPTKNINRCIYGAPDLVLEVLSPSTRRRDMYLKLGKYANAGCREYWIVDQEHESVIVYIFDDDSPVHVYTFDDRVPVGISDGKCEIDLSVVKERLSRGQR